MTTCLQGGFCCTRKSEIHLVVWRRWKAQILTHLHSLECCSGKSTFEVAPYPDARAFALERKPTANVFIAA